jgi:hypothetical protein
VKAGGLSAQNLSVFIAMTLEVHFEVVACLLRNGMLAPFLASVQKDACGFDEVEQDAEHLTAQDGFLGDDGELAALADADPQLFEGIRGVICQLCSDLSSSA